MILLLRDKLSDMVFDIETLASLLSMEEGPTLDFKREQYCFNKATRKGKSELLKDILAFANAHRDRTAHILIGVEEVKDGRSEVVGVESHLEDASLQEFVNSKTNRPLECNYFPFSVEDKSIGVISIPIQQRPVWTIKDYGLVNANEVYIRHGSSNQLASPDEIAAMGRGNPPKLRAEWGDARRRTVYPADYVHRNTGLKLPDEFQAWDGTSGNYDFEALVRRLGEDPNVFHGSRVTSIRERAMYKPLGLRFFNNSGSVGENVRFNAILEDRGYVQFQPPRTLLSPRIRRGPEGRKLQCVPSGRGMEISVEVGHIRPGEYVWAGQSAQFSTKMSRTLIWKGRFVADNLPEPIECLLPLQVEYEEREIQTDDLKQPHQPTSYEWLP